MSPTLLFVLAIFGVLALAFQGAAIWAWTLFVALILVLAGVPIWGWIGFGVLALFANIPLLGRRFVSGKIGAKLVAIGMLPRISETERVALEAGQVWMDGEIFSGKPNLKVLNTQKDFELSKEEQEYLDGPVEEVCKLMDEWKAWQQEDLSPEIWQYLKDNKFFGLIVDRAFGGVGLSATGLSAVIKKLASRSFALSVTVMIPNSLGPAELLGHYGTDEQKNHYLPMLASGEHMPCFALTESQAGSDAGAIAANGKVFRSESGELMLRLNWEKRYTSLATVATIVGLAFKLKDPENLLGQGTEPGITCALIPVTTPGVVCAKRHNPLGVPFHNCSISGEDVVVSCDSIIGGPEYAGQGWRMLMECLAAGRGVTLPASSVANAKMAARVAGSYAALRQQFGMPVAKFGGVEEPLARIAGRTYIMESVRRYTCSAVDQGVNPSVVSAIVKYQLTEMSRQVLNDAMDIMAGAGISRGPRNLIANYYIAAPIPITVEGANILTRSMIIYGQGAMRCHPFARAQVEALNSGDVSAFDAAFWGHAGHFVRNSARAILLSLTRGRIARAPGSGLVARSWQRLSWASASFAVVSDLAMISLGGALKRHEKLTGRLADILSWMYLISASLNRFEQDGRPDEDRPHLEWAMAEAFTRLQSAFDECYANFPAPILSWILRGPVGFWSRMNRFAKAPSDGLGSKLAASISHPSPQRERHLAGLYLPKESDEALAKLESALRLAADAALVLQKVAAAIKAGELDRGRPESRVEMARDKGVISAAEADLVVAARNARLEATEVDAFPAESFGRAH